MGKTIKSGIYDEIQKSPKDLLWQKRVYKKDDMREYQRLCRELDRPLYTKKNSGKHSRYPGMVSDLSSRQRRMVKVRIGKNTASHTRFIREYLPQENKTGGCQKTEAFQRRDSNR